MDSISKDQLLSLFSGEVQPKINAALEKPSVRGLLVYENVQGKRKALPLIDKPASLLDDEFRLIAKYEKIVLDTSQSRTMAALGWLKANPEAGVAAAAHRYGITPNAVYRAVRRRKDRVICPCCNQVVPEGFTLP